MKDGAGPGAGRTRSTMSTRNPFELREHAFEAQYFQKKDQELVEALRKVFHKKFDKHEIREATGVTDEELLDRLVDIGVNGEMLLAFQLLPIVEVAWADQKPDEKTVRAVLEAGETHGVAKGSKGREMLERRLTLGPAEDLRKIWFHYAEALKKALTPSQLAEFREDLLGMCRRVAEASGGILGLVLKTSAREQRVMDRVKEALS
jgi:hypothetical protein